MKIWKGRFLLGGFSFESRSGDKAISNDKNNALRNPVFVGVFSKKWLLLRYPIKIFISIWSCAGDANNWTFYTCFWVVFLIFYYQNIKESLPSSTKVYLFVKFFYQCNFHWVSRLILLFETVIFQAYFFNNPKIIALNESIPTWKTFIYYSYFLLILLLLKIKHQSKVKLPMLLGIYPA